MNLLYLLMEPLRLYTFIRHGAFKGLHLSAFFNLASENPWPASQDYSEVGGCQEGASLSGFVPLHCFNFKYG